MQVGSKEQKTDSRRAVSMSVYRCGITVRTHKIDSTDVASVMVIDSSFIFLNF